MMTAKDSIHGDGIDRSRFLQHVTDMWKTLRTRVRAPTQPECTEGPLRYWRIFEQRSLISAAFLLYGSHSIAWLQFRSRSFRRMRSDSWIPLHKKLIYEPIKKGVQSEESCPDTTCKANHRTSQERDAGAAIDGVCPQQHARQDRALFERTGDQTRESVKPAHTDLLNGAP